MKCPHCASEAVRAGKIETGDNHPAFRPDGLRFWTLSTGCVLLDETAHACEACGFVWGHLDGGRLRDLIRDVGA